MESLLLMGCLADCGPSRDWLLISSQFFVAVVALTTPFLLHWLDERRHERRRTRSWRNTVEAIIYELHLARDMLGVQRDMAVSKVEDQPEQPLRGFPISPLLSDPSIWTKSLSPVEIEGLFFVTLALRDVQEAILDVNGADEESRDSKVKNLSEKLRQATEMIDLAWDRMNKCKEEGPV